MRFVPSFRVNLRLFALVPAGLICMVAAAPIQEQQPQQPRPPQVQPQQAQDLQSNPVNDQRASDLVQQVRQSLAKAKSVSVDVEHALVMAGPFGKEQTASSYDLAVQRPDKIALRHKQGQMGETIVNDGENLYIHFPSFNRYLKEDAPANLNELFSRTEAEQSLGSGPLSLMGPFLLTEQLPEQFGKVVSHSFAGEEDVNGKKVSRVRVLVSPNLDQMPPEAQQALKDKQVNMPVDLLIQQGEKPAVHAMIVNLGPMMSAMMQAMQDEMGEPAEPQPKDLEYRMELRFSNWQLDQEIPQERLAFQPPKDAREVESMFEAMMPPDANELSGKPAPDFSLPKLGEGTVNLASHQGKDIVILDFWASWCGPCVKGMPGMLEVAKEYKDRNVAFYAVNLGEDDDKVRTFISGKNWEMTTLMDRQGEVARKYMVSAIPQTVIVDKDGTIQVVHIGMTDPQQLRKELDSLLNGTKLAPKS